MPNVVTESASHGIIGGDTIPDGSTLQQELLRAAASGDIQYLNRILQFDFDLSVVDDNDNSACMLATANRHPAALVALLERGANANIFNSRGITPLHKACENKDLGIVKELVRFKASMDIAAPFTGTPALIACKAGFTDIVSLLLDAKADPDVCTQGESLLTVCAEKNDQKMLDIVMKSKPNLETVDLNGYTSLMIASQKGYSEIVRVLLSAKADATHISPEGSTAIYLADFMGHADVVSLLEQFGAKIGNAELLKLHTLVEKGELRSVHLVVRNGGDINEGRQSDGMNALMLAAAHGFLEIVEYLLDRPQVDIFKRNKKGESALHVCCSARAKERQENSAAIIELLLKKSAEALLKKAADAEEEKQKLSKTTKGAAESEKKSQKKSDGVYGSMKERKFLGPEAGNIDEWDSNGRTAFHQAISSGNKTAAVTLINAKASLLSKDKAGLSPLHFATRADSKHLAGLLIDHKADVCASDQMKRTPLHLACQYSTMDVIKALVEAKANINASTKDGTTPLYLACCYGDVEVADYLVMKGADHKICDDFGDYDPYKSLKKAQKESRKFT